MIWNDKLWDSDNCYFDASNNDKNSGNKNTEITFGNHFTTKHFPFDLKFPMQTALHVHGRRLTAHTFSPAITSRPLAHTNSFLKWVITSSWETVPIFAPRNVPTERWAWLPLVLRDLKAASARSRLGLFWGLGAGPTCCASNSSFVTCSLFVFFPLLLLFPPHSFRLYPLLLFEFVCLIFLLLIFLSLSGRTVARFYRIHQTKIILSVAGCWCSFYCTFMIACICFYWLYY